MNSKEIEAAVQKVEDRLAECDINVSIMVYQDDEYWNVSYTYSPRKGTEVTEDACSGMFEHEVIDFLEDELFYDIVRKMKRNEATQNAQMAAINKFLYYSWNYISVPHEYANGHVEYVPDVIEGAEWTCNRDHICSHWIEGGEKDPHAFIPLFYSRLDDNNRKAMMKWILENYDREHHMDF